MIGANGNRMDEPRQPADVSPPTPDSQRKPFYRRSLGRLGGGLVVLALLVFLFFVSDWGTVSESCSMCGAGREGRYVSVLGLSVDFAHEVQEGPVARRIQAFDRRPCAHTWEFAYSPSSVMLSAKIGPGWNRRWIVTGLERSARADELLQAHVDRDQDFPARLAAAIRAVPPAPPMLDPSSLTFKPNGPGVDPFIRALLDELDPRLRASQDAAQDYTGTAP